LLHPVLSAKAEVEQMHRLLVKKIISNKIGKGAGAANVLSQVDDQRLGMR
jgi:hypothetical protein